MNETQRRSLSFDPGVIVLLAFLIVLFAAIPLSREWAIAVATPFLLWFSVVAGCLGAGYDGELKAGWERKYCGTIWVTGDYAAFKERAFVIRSIFMSLIFVGGYTVAACSHYVPDVERMAKLGWFERFFHLEFWPINPFVVFLSMISLAAMSFFAVRYGAYVRALSILQYGLGQDPASEAAQKARAAVVRGENLFEPPGTIFVTIGITATFLGLAVALITLNLPSLFSRPSGDETNIAKLARETASVLALNSFIACMGLSLGMSMLGVLHTICAQWLRGHGPNETTETLLARAASAVGPGRADRDEKVDAALAGLATTIRQLGAKIDRNSRSMERLGGKGPGTAIAPPAAAESPPNGGTPPWELKDGQG